MIHLNRQSDYTKNRNYWKYLKNKLKKENSELVSTANQLKLVAPDGKRRLTDCFDVVFLYSICNLEEEKRSVSRPLKNYFWFSRRY